MRLYSPYFHIYTIRTVADPSIGLRSAFAGGIIEGCAKNDFRDIVKRAEIEGTSLDAPIEGGKADSVEKTHADVYPETSELMPMNFRGARRIRLETDLHLARSLMSEVDWKIFSLRWKFGISNAELARELNWTENKLRWHLKNYEARYANLFGVKRMRR